MEINQKPKILKNSGAYLKKSFKFYNLKEEQLTPLIFITMLAVIFFDSIVIAPFPGIDNLENIEDAFFSWILSSFIVNLLIQPVLAVYLTASIKEFKGEIYSMKQCVVHAVKKTPRILIAYTLFSLPVLFALVLLYFPFTAQFLTYYVVLFLVPGIIFYLMFVFNISFIVDREKGIIAAFKSSVAATDGQKLSILGIIVTYFFAEFPVMTFVSSLIQSSSDLIQIFVSSFGKAVFALVYVRMISLMYVDIEHGPLHWERDAKDKA